MFVWSLTSSRVLGDAGIFYEDPMKSPLRLRRRCGIIHRHVLCERMFHSHAPSGSCSALVLGQMLVSLAPPPGPAWVGCNCGHQSDSLPSTWRLSVSEKGFGTLLARMLPRRSRGGTQIQQVSVFRESAITFWPAEIHSPWKRWRNPAG